MDPDAQLMLKVREGDLDAYDALVRRYQFALVNFFFKLIWNRQDAEDFAQDVFVKVFVAREQYQERAKFSTYLFRVAANYWIDYLRTKGKRKKAVSLDQGAFSTEEREHKLGDALASDHRSPPDELLRNELWHKTQEAIESLPEDQKIPFLLCETQGMKYQEIADTLDLPLGTVKSRIHAAVMKLREMLVTKGVM